MLDQVAAVTRIRMLYFQLLYQCNFSCQHCFHGEMLKAPDSFTLVEAQAMLDHFTTSYGLDAVTFLGGEPLLYPDIAALCRYAKNSGLSVEICTNAHRSFRSRIESVAPQLAKLRVSMDGMRDCHDRMRRSGSFASAVEMIDFGCRLGVPVGVTMTVTRQNIGDVVPLARLLQEHGVSELKLHALRLVGNAVNNPELEVTDVRRYADLHEQIEDAGLSITVIYDADLSPQTAGESCSNLVSGGWLDRIESDPRGGLTVSCKAVGKDVNAFRWDKAGRVVVYEPTDSDEFAAGIPNVIYRTAGAR